MNRQHPSITSSVEVENNDALSFLDINNIGVSSKLLRNLYRKETFSDVYTNFDNLVSFG